MSSYFFDKNKRYSFIQVYGVHRYNINSKSPNKNDESTNKLKTFILIT